MKKLLAILLVVALLPALFACGGQPAETEKGSESESGTEAETQPVSETAAIESESETRKAEPYEKPTEPIDVADTFLCDEITYECGEEEYTLPYRIFLPEGYSRDFEYPVLLFLHGAGERGDDNELQLKNVVQLLYNDVDSPVYGAIVVCPQCPEEMRWVESDWALGAFSIDKTPLSVPMTGVMALLDDLFDSCSVDEDRVYVMGLSMGGYGTWDLIERNPDLFAAAVAMCSGGDPEYAVCLQEMPILIVHGDADGTVPVAGSRGMVAALEEAGSTAYHYVEVPGASHNVWDYTATECTVDGVKMIDWLFAQDFAER